MKNYFLFVVALAVTSADAQSVTSRTNDFEIDFSDPKKLVKSTVPTINWIIPAIEYI